MDCFVKESYGVVWHFYHNRHGICFCKMKDEKITEYSVLIADAQGDFDIVVDDSDCLHLVCQNKGGDILYINRRNGEWKTTTLLKSKRATSYSKDFIIKRVGGILNLFYCIEHNGNRMLTHQFVGDPALPPRVVDCIRGDFCAATDTGGNIILLFYSETQKSYGTKKYVWSQKNWEDFKPENGLCGAKNPYLYVDGDSNVHIVFESDGCIKHICGENSEILGVGKLPIMFFQKDLHCMWEGADDSKIYIKKQNETAPTVFMPGGFAKPCRMRLRYTSYESDINAEICPGNISDGSVKIYGVKNFFVVSKNPPTFDISSFAANVSKGGGMLATELQKLKIRIDKIEAETEKLREAVKNINRQET